MHSPSEREIRDLAIILMIAILILLGLRFIGKGAEQKHQISEAQALYNVENDIYEYPDVRKN